MTAAVAANTCASMRLYITTMTVHTKALPDTYSKMELWRELLAKVTSSLAMAKATPNKSERLLRHSNEPKDAKDESGSLRRTSHPLLLNSGPYERSLTET